MSTEDRLFNLVVQARQSQGEAILHQPDALKAALTGQAPDLSGEIAALADALAANVITRIGAAANADEEAGHVAAEIAGRDKLSMAVVKPAIAVARRLHAAPAMPPAGGAGDWAGDSQVPGVAPPPPAPPAAPAFPQDGYPPAPPAYPAQPPFGGPGGFPPPGPPPGVKPVWQRPPVLAGAAAAAALIGYLYTQSPKPAQPVTPIAPAGPVAPGPAGPVMAPAGPTGPAPDAPGGPNPAEPAGPDPQPQQGGGDLPPALGDPNGQVPTLRTSTTSGGDTAILFSVPAGGQSVVGVVTVPKNGWDAGPGQVGFLKPGSQQLDTQGLVQYQRGQGTQHPQRLGQPKWDRDNLGIGQICVGFQGQGGDDVATGGATMCLLDASCQRALACGSVGGQ